MAKKPLLKPTPEELARYPALDRYGKLRQSSALHKLRDPKSVAGKRPFGARSLGEAIPIACRFYGRILSFQLACPHCGEVWRVRSGVEREKGKSRSGGSYRRYYRANRVIKHQGMGFDPLTSRWQCGACMRVFIVGLLMWAPVHTEAAFPPPDQALNPVESDHYRHKYPSLLANSFLPADLPSNAVLQKPLKPSKDSIDPIEGEQRNVRIEPNTLSAKDISGENEN